jgi:hypothetical protein
VHPSPPQATRSTQRQDGDCSCYCARPTPPRAGPPRHKINATSGPGLGGGFDGRPGPGWQRFSVNLSHAAFAPRREQKGCQKATIYAASECSDAVKKKEWRKKRRRQLYRPVAVTRLAPVPPPAGTRSCAAVQRRRRSESVTVRPPAACVCVYSTRCCFKAQQSARPRDTQELLLALPCTQLI